MKIETNIQKAVLSGLVVGSAMMLGAGCASKQAPIYHPRGVVPMPYEQPATESATTPAPVTPAPVTPAPVTPAPEVKPLPPPAPVKPAVTLPPVPKAVEEASFFHTVKSGDSLSIIAYEHSANAKEAAALEKKIMAMNGLSSPTKIRVGQKLRIPGSGAKVREYVRREPVRPAHATPGGGTPADATPAAGDTGTEGGTAAPQANTMDHTVCEGDSIDSIASMYNTTAAAIMEANPSIKSAMDPLTAGTVIKVPVPTM